MKKAYLSFAVIAALALIAIAFTGCKQKDTGGAKTKISREPDSSIYGKWCYVQTPDTPHEMTYNPPRVEIMPDNTATYFGYGAYWIGTLSEMGENKYRFHVTGEWGEGVFYEKDEEWIFEHDPAAGQLNAYGNDFVKECVEEE